MKRRSVRVGDVLKNITTEPFGWFCCRGIRRLRSVTEEELCGIDCGSMDGGDALALSG